MRVLFVCNQGRHRSRTAAELFHGRFQTRYAGVYSEERPVTAALLSWADVVVVMEDHQRQEISEQFPKEYGQKRILSLDIPDVYGYQQPELVDRLKERFTERFESTLETA